MQQDVQVKIAVVGAGISGVACAQVLVRAGHQVVVLDRGRVPGGRMASRRFPPSMGRYVDIGASYFTVREPGFQSVVDDWADRGLARAWTDRFDVWEDGGQAPKVGPVRWSAALGLRSLIADLAEGLDVRQSTQVEQVARVGAAGGPVTVDGEPFDAVVLAMPDPQALAVLDPGLTVERQVISGRAWQPVLVLSARWAQRSWDWDGVFVHGSTVLDWVADDGSRRGDGAAVLTAHSTPAFAATRLASPADSAGDLLAALIELGLNGLGGSAPVEVLGVQRWTYAKPVGTRAELFSLSPSQIGFCGDGWGQARIEAAWLSGTALGHALA